MAGCERLLVYLATEAPPDDGTQLAPTSQTSSHSCAFHYVLFALEVESHAVVVHVGRAPMRSRYHNQEVTLFLSHE